MPNTIELAKKYIPMLDEVYKNASLTAVLDGAAELAQQGANANELIIPTLDMQGLGDYERNSGYVKGDVTMTNATVKCNFDRGRMFNVDVMDNEETAGLAFGRLAGEFIRTKVVPELDAFRFASYASKDGVGKKEELLEDGSEVLAALREASTQMDEAEVSLEERYLFITPTLYGMIADLDLTRSRGVLERFAQVVQVPQTRFYTKISQKTGRSGQEMGGYEKAADGKELNFMIVHRPAVIQFEKHISPKIITPMANPDADAYKFGYRNVGIADVYQHKLAGVYASVKADA